MCTLHLDLNSSNYSTYTFIIGTEDRYLFTGLSAPHWFNSLRNGEGWPKESNTHRFGPLVTTFNSWDELADLPPITREWLLEHHPEYLI